MRILKRRKIIKEFLESRIEKNQRRIQKISEETYKLRLQLDALNATSVQTPLTKADLKAQADAKETADKTAATEPVLDNADQEIGMSVPAEENTNAVS